MVEKFESGASLQLFNYPPYLKKALRFMSVVFLTPLWGQERQEKYVFRPYLPNESIVFLRALSICSSLRYRKTEIKRDFIFKNRQHLKILRF